MKRLALLLALLQTGCVSFYKGVPKDAPQPPSRQGVLHYKFAELQAAGLGNGRGALREFFKSGTGFSEVREVPAAPEKGLYCEVVVKWKPPTVLALIFGYISLGFMTILPAWSLHEGYEIEYRVFKDAKPVRTFTYELTRKGAVWIVLLPLIWINAITMSEGEAFTRTGRQFVADAGSLLGS
jgi:hypothetical protein